MLEPTPDNPITDKDREFAKLLGLDPRTVWVARQPLPPLAHFLASRQVEEDDD